ncbi:MAG TPA: DUF2804 domain-containing protein [Anaerolineaceae bacterium]|jgi:hypothetical protein|nr:DUF2804 domain-containing protein [Anaerolineaceae bacterium]
MPDLSFRNTLHPEPELTRPVDLCAGAGRLNRAAVGWSRQPLHNCNVSGHWPRKKRWNYWCVTSPDCLFSATISHIDYLGMAFIYFLDFNTLAFAEQTIAVPLGRGFTLPPTVTGRVAYQHQKLQLSFDDQGDRIALQAASQDLGGKSLTTTLDIHRPAGHETLNAVIPWDADHFQFTSKQNCLPVSGSLTYQQQTYHFSPESAFACLDYGRGIWPYASSWNWASFSTRQNGRTIGVNLGAKWTDGTGMTENGLAIDGRLTKLSEKVDFIYDSSNWMAPWRLETHDSERVRLVFTPFFERVARTDALILTSEVHQMIGRFDGTLITAAGETVTVSAAVGWAEDHHARW